MYGYDPAQWKQDENSDRNFRNLSIIGQQVGGAIDSTIDEVGQRQAERKAAKKEIANKQLLTGMSAEEVASDEEQKAAKDSLMNRLVTKLKGTMTGAAEERVAAPASQKGAVDEKYSEALKPYADLLNQSKNMSYEELKNGINKRSAEVAFRLASTDSPEALLAKGQDLQKRGLVSSDYNKAAVARMIRDEIQARPGVEVNSGEIKKIAREKYGISDDVIASVPEFNEVETLTIDAGMLNAGEGYAFKGMVGQRLDEKGEVIKALPTAIGSSPQTDGATVTTATSATGENVSRPSNADTSGYEVNTNALRPFGAGVPETAIALTESRLRRQLTPDEVKKFTLSQQAAMERDKSKADTEQAKINANRPRGEENDDTIKWQQQRDKLIYDKANIRRQIDFLQSKNVKSSNQLSKDDLQTYSLLSGTDENGKPIANFTTIDEALSQEMSIQTSLQDIDRVLAGRGFIGAQSRLVGGAGSRNPANPSAPPTTVEAVYVKRGSAPKTSEEWTSAKGAITAWMKSNGVSNINLATDAQLKQAAKDTGVPDYTIKSLRVK